MPNKNNRQIWRLEKEIDTNISKLVKQCPNEGHEQDLLQMILEGAKNHEGSDGLLSNSISQEKFIIDNCKNIFFAGHETTAITASWCLMLLATYQDWQDRARAEVLEVCGNGSPDASMLRSMKTVCFTLKLHVSIKCIKSIALQINHLDLCHQCGKKISIQEFFDRKQCMNVILNFILRLRKLKSMLILEEILIQHVNCIPNSIKRREI